MEDLDYRNGTYYTVFKNLSESIILKHCDWIELGIFEFLRQNSNILAGKLKSYQFVYNLICSNLILKHCVLVYYPGA